MGQIVFRKNQLSELKSLVSGFNAKKIFLVRDNLSFTVSGAETFIQDIVNVDDKASFYKFNPNPKIQDLKKGIEIFKKGDFDLIIAIGGGSVLDMAKLISVFAHQKFDINEIVTEKFPIESIKTPLLAVPTTAGTGAEATRFSVLYVGKKKFSVSNPAILPDYVYLSSEFSLNAPSYLTACTGLDAFCQAIESVWSVNCNEESEKYALHAIELAWSNLEKAVRQDVNAKEQMQQASYLAGKAINITTTTAPHALSYAFTSFYNIPHGHAVALSLPFFLSFNYQLSDINCIDPRGYRMVRKRIDKILEIFNTNIDNAYVRLTSFFSSLGVEMNIRLLIKNFSPEIILQNVNLERLSNNPRKVSENDINDFLNFK